MATRAERREAADLYTVGKYEPKLTENGIPADVLEKLLPGDDVIELTEPKVAGGFVYRFVKRAFDIVSCGCCSDHPCYPHGRHCPEDKVRVPWPRYLRTAPRW